MCLGALEGECDELREVAQALLRVCAQRLSRGYDVKCSPGATAGVDRCGDCGSVAGLAHHPRRFTRYVRVVVDAAAFAREPGCRPVRVGVGDERSDLEASALTNVPAAHD